MYPGKFRESRLLEKKTDDQKELVFIPGNKYFS